MAFHFHKNRDLYIRQQRANAAEFLIPFIEKSLPIVEGMHVMEIGCGEGGVLKAFLDRGCQGVGIELLKGKAERARDTLKAEIASGQAIVMNKNIYDIDVATDVSRPFDLIILKDVIEHIHDQDAILNRLRDFLRPGGHIFFGFPPWQMPFGGHQQVLAHRFLSRTPYFHLLPVPLYRGILKAFGETQASIENTLEIKETGISIERFERLVRKNHFSIALCTYYLFNPIYKYKFNLTPRVQFGLLTRIPYFRNFVTTCMYYLVQKED